MPFRSNLQAQQNVRSQWNIWTIPRARRGDMDKVNAALAAALEEPPLAGFVLGSMVDLSAHRDQLATTNAIYE